MESLYENKTEYTQDLYNKFLAFHSKKFGVQELIFYTITIIVLISLTIRAFNTLKWKVILIWLIILLGVLVYRKGIKKSKEQYVRIAKSKNETVKYKFYERYFETVYHGELSKIYYIEIKKVYELTDRYYLYLNRDHACIVLKDGFIKGEEEQFREFLDTKGMFRMKKVK